MAVDLMEVLWGQTNQVRDNVKSVHLKLLELRWGPSCDDWVAIDGVWIEVKQEGSQEALLHHDVVSLNVALSMANGEDLSPEELLQLQVLVSHVEDGLVLIPVHLVKDGVGDHLLEDALLTVLLQEKLVALGARHDVVDQHTDFVTETLVVFLISPSEHHFEGGLERRDHLWVDGKLDYSFFASNLNQVPQGFNGKGDDIGAEVLGLTNDAHKVPADTLQDDLVRDRFEQTDGSNCLQD